MSAQSRRTAPPRLRQLVRVGQNNSHLFSLSVILMVSSFDYISMAVFTEIDLSSWHILSFSQQWGHLVPDQKKLSLS